VLSFGVLDLLRAPKSVICEYTPRPVLARADEVIE
jgi:hypothetical protein